MKTKKSFVSRFKKIWRGKIRPKLTWKRLVVVTSIILAGNGFLTAYVCSENTIYRWDDAYFYRGTIELANKNPISMLSETWNSIESDYTLLAQLPVAVALKTIGWDGGRLGFVLAVFNIYLVPTMLLGGYAIGKLFKKNRFKILAGVMLLATFSPIIMTPIIKGRIDVSGLLIIMVIFTFLLQTWRKKKLSSSVMPMLFLAGLVVLLIITKRFYAYWIVSTVLSSFLIVFIWSAKKKRWAWIKEYVVKIGCVTIFSIVLLFAISPSKLASFFGDYQQSYAHWHSDSITQIANTASYIGLTMLALLAYSSVVAIKNKSKIISRASIMACAQIIIVGVIFFWTQDPDEHHYYLFVPSAIYLVSVAFFTKKHLVLNFIMGGVILFNFLNAYVFGVSSMFLTKPYTPQKQEGIEDVRKMAEYVEGLEGYVCPLTISSVFDEHLIKNAFLPDINRIKNTKFTHYVDARDGFPKHFWGCSYVLVQEGYDYEWLPETMQSVRTLTKHLMNGDMENLEPVKKFELQDGEQVIILKKTEEYSDGLVNEIDQTMRDHYPNHPELWAK